MKNNISLTDRIIRIVLIVVLTGLFITRTASGIWGVLAITLGAYLVFTTVLNACPLYKLLGIQTCKK